MRFPTGWCLAVLMSAGACQLRAQEAAAPTPRPTPPPPPFVNDAPDFAAWTITQYTIPGAGSQPADAVIRSAAAASKPDSLTSVVKTAQVRHQVRHKVRKLKTGEQEDIWYEHGNRITMESIWKAPVFQGEVSGAKSPAGSDFPELSWISAGNFVGTQEVQGLTYLVFEMQASQGSATQAKAYGYQLKSVFDRVYINADTRMPWLLQSGDVLQRYAFQPAPTAPLDVPPEYQAMFDNYEKRKLEAARKPIAP